MAVLYVAEFGFTGGVSNFNTSAVEVPPIAEQTIAIGASSTAVANPFNTNTNIVRLETDTICSVAFGVAPTATVGNMRMAANTVEYFSIPPASKFKVAAITNS